MRIRSVGYFPKSTDQSCRPEEGGIHPYYELLYLSSGTFKLEWLGERYSCSGPCIFLLTPNSPHRLEAIGKPIEYFYIELDLDNASMYPSLPQIIQWNSMQGSMEHDSSLAKLLFRSLDLLWDTTIELEGSQRLVDITLLETSKILFFIQELLAQDVKYPDEEKDQGHLPMIESLLRYLEANYKEYITLKTLSSLVHMSESYIIRIFKLHKGVTPFQYLEQLRMNAAVSYLLNTSFTIQQITELIGYNSIHYFSRHFKQKYGISPSQWRDERKCQYE